MEGAGVINRSMEGAATGNPIDMCGALYWNIGGLTQIKRSMLCMGTEFFTSDLNLESAYPGGGFLGEQNSDFPVSAIPTFGGVYRPKDSKWIFGAGMQSLAGFGVQFDEVAFGSPDPILYSQANGGFGGVSSRYTQGQIVMGAAYQVNEKLSLGFSPILAYAKLEVDPFPGTNPSPTKGYPNVDEAGSFGYGAQFGFLYRFNPEWSVGACYRSTTNFSPFRFDATYLDGTPAPRFSFDMDFPSITSLGVGYIPTDKLTLNLDVRYIDYEHTDGFRGEAQFTPTGAVSAFGWKSIWMVAAGVQYKATDWLTLRAGYSYNENPISSRSLFFNIEAPAIIQHHVSIGCSCKLSDNVIMNLACSYGFRNSVSGEMPGAPGSRVRAEMSTFSSMVGFGYLF